MAYNMAFNAYKQTGVKTATQGKLVVMLYEEAVRQLGTAISWYGADSKVAPKNMDKLNSNILKTQEIITELMVSLNMNVEGDIAKNLLSLYVFFNQELMDANINFKKEKLVFVRNKMAELKDAWATAESMTSTKASEMSPSISISG